MDMQINDSDLQTGREVEISSAGDLSIPSVNYDDMAEVLKRIFAVVETYPDGGCSAWFYFLNDWDRRFVLNIYDMWTTTGRVPLSEKQAKKARVILRKMMTPCASMG